MLGSCFGFSCNVELLHKKSKLLMDKAFDVEKEVNGLENSQRKVRKPEVASWLEEVTILNVEFVNLQRDLLQENGFMSHFLKWVHISELSLRFDELLQQHKNFHGLLVVDTDELLQQHKDFHGSLVDDAEITRGVPFFATSLSGDAFEKNVERIWKCVVVDKIQIVGIYGMGGVGKTTLAMHMHDLLLDKSKDHVHWVTVPKEFSLNKFQDDIAKVIGLNLSTLNDEHVRAASLKKALSRKNDFVLILDDVWDSTSLIEGGITDRLEGCRLIITTRSLEVCRQIGCCEIVSVQTLCEDEAWNLFRFTLRPLTTLTPQVEEIAKVVAKECDGLPLGIVTLAMCMRGETDIRMWKYKLLELKECRLGKDLMEKEVFGVLKYSFDELDPNYKRQYRIMNGYTNLQLCFLYCSLYPEDYKIDKDELITGFISEQLLDERERRDEKFVLGHVILNKLVKVCLLESTRLNNGHNGVKMHVLVRDMAIKITRDNPKFKVLAGLSLKEFPSEEEYWTEDLEKMSLMENDIPEILEGMSPNCPKLSTLFLNRNMKLTFIPDSFFSLLSGLSVLNLSWTMITLLPNSLSGLESLNALILDHCQELVYVPYLGKLKALRELDLAHTKIEEVPQGMENLVNLEYLSLDGTWCLKMLPTGLLPRFKYLQYLCLPFQTQVAVEEIECLKHLEMF